MFRKFLKLSTMLIIAMMAGFFVSCVDSGGEAYYTVSFDSNGGNSIEPIKVVGGECIGSSMPSPERTGWYFGGWYDSEGNKISDSTSINKHLKVKAKWQVIVNFYYGQALDIKKEKFVDIGSEITAPDVSSYEKDGKEYKFYFWSKDNTATDGDKNTKILTL